MAQVEHLNLFYEGVFDAEERMYIVACGARIPVEVGEVGCVSSPYRTTCELCKATYVYKDLLATVELAFDGNYHHYLKSKLAFDGNYHHYLKSKLKLSFT